MDEAMSKSNKKLNRDGYTWYLYLMLAICGYHQSVLGSITPFLRDEMSLTKTVIGWHFGVYALGLIITGLIVTILSRNNYSTALLTTASAWLMVAFVAMLAIPMPLTGTLFGSLLLGLSGGALQITVQETLARYHGHKRGIALTEGCIFAGLGVFAGPLVIGLALKMGFGWRETLIVPALLLVLLFLCFRKARPNYSLSKEVPAVVGVSANGKLPLAVFFIFGMILLGIATEWGIGFWGAQFLEVQLDVSPGEGVTIMSAFFGGTVLGRIFASKLLQFFEIRSLLISVIVLGGGSVLLLWAVPNFKVTVAALVIAGMCLGNFFPLILSIANELAPEKAGAISAGATQSVGMALLFAPALLGGLGESIGLISAVGLLAFLPLGMLFLYIFSNISIKRLASSKSYTL